MVTIKYTQFQGNNPFGSQSKMLYHLDSLQEYIKEGDTYPFFLEINLSSRCNLKCEWCISENFTGNDYVDKDSLLSFLGEFYEKGGKAVNFSGGGEPTLHPDFEEIVIDTNLLGIDIGIMTNGAYNKSINDTIGTSCKWIRFSVDTLIKENYKKWKGIDFTDKVIKNILELKNYPVRVGINCNVTKEHTIKDIQSLVNIMPGAANYIQFRPVLPRYFKNEKPDINETVWDWLDNYQIGRDYVNLSNDKFDDILYKNTSPFDSCEGHFFNPIIDSNGDLCVCMYHPNDSNFVFGNIYEDTFEDIWKSDKRKQVIEYVRKLNYCNECQMCCKLTEINKFLMFVNHPEKGIDINFL